LNLVNDPGGVGVGWGWGRPFPIFCTRSQLIIHSWFEFEFDLGMHTNQLGFLFGA
jgi:hypothetical protein